MSDSDNAILSNTIGNIFNKQKQLHTTGGKHNKGKRNEKELELSLAVLLVDLASCDQDFDPAEYQVISSGLRRMFGTSKMQLPSLVNQAKSALANLRGVSQYASKLKEELDEDEKKAVIDIIEDLIMADGKEDGYETYMRAKFMDLLGVENKEKHMQ